MKKSVKKCKKIFLLLMNNTFKLRILLKRKKAIFVIQLLY